MNTTKSITNMNTHDWEGKDCGQCTLNRCY